MSKFDLAVARTERDRTVYPAMLHDLSDADFVAGLRAANERANHLMSQPRKAPAPAPTVQPPQPFRPRAAGHNRGAKARQILRMRGTQQSIIAERLGVSPAYVCKVLKVAR